MKKRTLKILLGILLAIPFCWGCFALDSFISPLGFEGKPDVLYKKDEYFAFDAQTILQDAVEGKPVQLIPVPGEPEIFPSGSPVVPWKQADYLRVANAVFLSVWGETSANWKLKQITAQTNCAGVAFGFQRMSFMFFKIDKNEDDDMYVHTQREIFIVPEKNLIWLYERESSPVTPLRLWDIGLDVDTIIPAEEALRIVEENGGRSARMGIDKCTISVDAIAESNDNNWQVWYSSGYNHFIKMEVDEKTGEILR